MKKITFMMAFAVFFISWQARSQVCTGFTSTTTDTTTFINNVSTTGGISNISNLESGLSAGRYQDNFATSSVTSFAEGAFSFSVGIQGGTVGCAIWVDWNGDFTFDIATEKVYNTTAYGNGPFTGAITVPAGTANGDYYMRIMIDWNDANPDDNPCSFELASGRGEVEDYKVTVVTAPTDELDYYNLQWPPNGTINPGAQFDVYAQAYEAGLTDMTTGQAPGILCWIGYSRTNTNPNGAEWTWVPATFNSEVGNNDEYMLNLGALATSGIYYYASRWSLNGGPLTYGGIKANGDPGGTWGVDNNISGVLTVNAPSNDECANATELTVNSDLACGVISSGTVAGATDSGLTNSTCFGTEDDDVWYSFVATSTSHQVVLSNVVGSATDMYHVIYDGTGGCGTLGDALVCSDPNTSNPTGLTIGNTYYVQVYTYTGTGGQNTTFDICVGTPPPPPTNDTCAGALPLTESVDSSCANAVSGTTVSAGPSASGTCSATGKDVWYTYTPSQTANYVFNVTETQDFGFSSTYVSIYSGSCGTTTQVGTGCTSSTVTSALTAATQYYVVVRSTSATAGVDFNLCVYPEPAPPANDACAGALPLTESVDSSCANAVSGTTVSAGPSASGTCSATGKDVWYTFTPSQTTNYIFQVAETQDFGSSSTYVSVYSGTCGTTTQVGTGCTRSATMVALTAATQYYVVVRSTSTTAGVNFSLCAYPATPPANDACSGAITLTPGITFDANPISGNTSGAAGSGELPLPGCASYDPTDVTGFGGDVWYSVTVPADGNLTIETNANPTGSGGDSGMAVYTGSCGALALFECDDDDSPDGNYSLISIESIDNLANQTVFVRVWEYGGDLPLNFQVSAYNGTLSVVDVEQNGFTYFPNPVKNTLNLKAKSSIQNVSIYNMLGQEVLRTSPNSLTSEVNMGSLQTGAYFVKVTINDATETIRVIKQ